MTKEVWAPLYGFEDEYLISTHGRVLSRPRVVMRSDGSPLTIPGRIIKPCQPTDGYLLFSAHQGGIRKTVPLHRAVLESFVGPAPEGHEACHWDDVKTNNRLDNLRWATPSDNKNDQVRNGRHHYAKRTHCKRGHEFNEDNTYRRPDGGRKCKTCHREHCRRYRAAKQQRQKQKQEGVAS